MSQTEQLEKMRLEILGNKTDKSKDDLFLSKLGDAEAVALDTLYPFDRRKEHLPSNRRLKSWQVRCAIELYRAMERIGVQAYNENGLSVAYFSGLVSKDLLNELISKAGVPR